VEFDWAETLASCSAAQRRLAEESEREAIVQLTADKLRNRAEKAKKECADWSRIAERLSPITPEMPEMVREYRSMAQSKAALFAEVQRRFEERVAQLGEAAKREGPGKKPSSRPRKSRSSPESEPSLPQSADELIAALRKIRFFESYTPSAVELAEERIRRQFAKGISGPLREYYQWFPGFALAFIGIEEKWYHDPYGPLVKVVAENSFGMFQPKKISDKRDPRRNLATLSFVVEGEKYSCTAEDLSNRPPMEFLELIEEAFARHCRNLHFHETDLSSVPGATDLTTWTICTKRAYKALVKANLLPIEPAELQELGLRGS
jgi:hypothetical protein